MKKLVILLALLFFTLGLTACDGDDPDITRKTIEPEINNIY